MPAKKIGANTNDTNRSSIVRVRSCMCDEAPKAVPTRNETKIAWTPIASVTAAPISVAAIMNPSAPPGQCEYACSGGRA